MAQSSLGPSLSATVVTPDLDLTTAAYCKYLHQQIHSSGTVSAALARLWQQPSIAGARSAWLANALGEPWLEIVELEDSPVVDPFRHRGWMSLEINVADVDALRPGLEGGPFEIIGEPANLDVSDDIRAMQVIGPAGEVLYLTEVRAEVPPFELPFARCIVDRLFIPVMLCDDRDEALAVYEQFPNTTGLKFETKVTVINRARGLELKTRHPVSTIQLRGNNLIEIDQLDGLESRPGLLPAGIAGIAFQAASLPPELPHQVIEEGPLAGRRAAMMTGAAGEMIQLIETDT